MGNVIKSGTTIIEQVATRASFKVGVNGSADYGPTDQTGFYNGITPPASGYTIYVTKETQGPSIHVANDDTQCIFFLKSFGATGSTISDVLTWANGQTNIWVTSSNITVNDFDITGATPTPTITPSVTITPTPTITVTPTLTITPTQTVTPTPVSDAIRAQLTTTQRTTYDAAAVGDWIKVTATQYNAIVSNVSGATKKGNSDAQVATRDVITSYSNQWLSFGTTGNPTFQINSGEYVIAMITEAWNQNTGQSQLGYTTSFNGNTITNYGGTAGPSTGGGRDYFIRKAPTDAATETRYPVLRMTVSPNAVNNWNGFRSADNGATWISLPNNQVAKIQIVTTSTKSW